MEITKFDMHVHYYDISSIPFPFFIPESKESSVWKYTFSDSLPKKTNEVPGVTENGSERKEAGTKPVVLVAEDNEENYILFKTILRERYEVLHAWNGKEAVEMCRQFQPDIILMDMNMPVMDGLEATREIRKQDDAVPIIAVTAYTFSRDEENSLEAGCNDYMPKPIHVGTLRKLVEKWLEEKSMKN